MKTVAPSSATQFPCRTSFIGGFKKRKRGENLSGDGTRLEFFPGPSGVGLKTLLVKWLQWDAQVNPSRPMLCSHWALALHRHQF